MAMVAGGQLGLVQGRARGQSESGSLEKLRKDTSERQAEAKVAGSIGVARSKGVLS